MDQLERKRYERKLQERFTPEHLRHSLISASLFLSAYEFLKSRILANTRDHFVEGIDARGIRYSSSYVSDVLSRDPKNRFRASCLWLAEMGAISSEDVEVAIRIRKHRNEVAHELAELVVDPDRAIDPGMFRESLRLIATLDRFWGAFAIDTDFEFEGENAVQEQPKSLGLLIMEYIVSVVGERAT